jgi:hypothetical protein
MIHTVEMRYFFPYNPCFYTILCRPPTKKQMKRNSGAIEEKLSLFYNAECLFAAGTDQNTLFEFD